MSNKFIKTSLCFVMVICFSLVIWAFDEQDDLISTSSQNEALELAKLEEKGPNAKDRILLKSINRLTFYRNKRTTSRRTHSIHQLSCVGGTAGCKLFTPNVIECDNDGYDAIRRKYNWKCHADVSNRVAFNHVEVICEGYDYPEDDYILLGSCGLEFTLDYKDPHDYHHNSYFKHMDDHEKELHHKKVEASAKHKFLADQAADYWVMIQQLMNKLTNHTFFASICIVLTLCAILLLKLFSKRNKLHNPKNKKAR